METIKSRFFLRPPVTEDPQQFCKLKKSLCLFCLILCGCTRGFASNVYLPGLPLIEKDLDSSSVATTLTASLATLILGIAPLIWAVLSERFRVRRCILIIAILIYALSSLGASFVKSIWPLVVLRMIQAVGSSTGQSVSAGVISDCYVTEERGAALSKLFFGVFLSPLIAPFIGGLLLETKLSWHAPFIFLFALGLFGVVFLFLFLPETFREEGKWKSSSRAASNRDSKNIENKDAHRPGNTLDMEEGTVRIERTESYSDLTASKANKERKSSLLQPFLLFKYPFFVMAALLMGVPYASIYSVQTLIPILFQKYYQFDSWQIGLIFLSGSVGNLVSLVLQNFVSDKLLLRARRLRGGAAVAEDRINIHFYFSYALIIASTLVWGWTIQFHCVYWIPVAALATFNFGLIQVHTSLTAYAIDCLPGSSASATASSNLVAMSLGCIFSIVCSAIRDTVGPGYLSLCIASLNFLLFPLPFFLKKYGKQLRERHGIFDEE